MRVAISGLYPPAHWTNVFYVRRSLTTTPVYSQLETWLEDILTEYGTAFAGVLSSNWQLVGAEGVMFHTGGPDRVFASTAVVGEIDTGTALPANIAVGISWRQALSYRGGHPRTYLCGANTEHLDDVTRLTGVAQGQFSTAANAFLTGVNAITGGATIGDTELGTVSFVVDGDWRTTPIFLPYLSGSVDLRIDSQRRRLGRDIPG